MSYYYHFTFWNTGRTPDEIASKPEGIRRFLLASYRVRLKELAAQNSGGDIGD